MAEYADTSLLKLALSISDTARDDLLSAALKAASRSIDDYCGRRFSLDEAESERVYRPASRVADDVFLVDDIGSVTGLKVEVGSAAGGWTDVTSEIEFCPENAVARGEAIVGLYRDNGWWFSSGERVRVTARWGWPAVPDEVVQATLILAARLYRRKDSPEGVIGSSEWGTVRLSRTDPDVAELVSRYVVPGFA